MEDKRWIKLAVKLAEQNLTMKELSERTGLHVKSIYRGMKKGHTVMRMDSIGRIAEALGVEVKDLI